MSKTQDTKEQDDARIIKHNHRLIAAAPDLYLALKSMLGQFETGLFQRNTDSYGCSDWALKAAGPLRVLADAQRAIAKAEGR